MDVTGEIADAFAGFPPHSCGGLIEALKVGDCFCWSSPVFPRIRAGASLKH